MRVFNITFRDYLASLRALVFWVFQAVDRNRSLTK